MHKTRKKGISLLKKCIADPVEYPLNRGGQHLGDSPVAPWRGAFDALLSGKENGRH